MILCSDCRYWKPLDEAGQCCINPPVIVLIGMEPVSAFPRTGPADGCGQGKSTNE